MSYTTRNKTLFGDNNPMYEGSHALLYRTGTSQFGHPTYNIAILKDGSWRNYQTDFEDWGTAISLSGLIFLATAANDQAKLISETFERGGIEDVVRLVARGFATWNMVYTLTGYYVNERFGEYVGPNKHSGKVNV